MINNLTDHIASILNISNEDARKRIENDKVIRKYLKSSTGLDSTGLDSTGLDKEEVKKRSIFILNGEETRLEKIFHLWFQRIGEEKKMKTIERFINGETKSRKGLKGYLKSTSIENIDTFILLFNLLINDGNLALNGGGEETA